MTLPNPANSPTTLNRMHRERAENVTKLDESSLAPMKIIRVLLQAKTSPIRESQWQSSIELAICLLPILDDSLINRLYLPLFSSAICP